MVVYLGVVLKYEDIFIILIDDSIIINIKFIVKYSIIKFVVVLLLASATLRSGTSTSGPAEDCWPTSSSPTRSSTYTASAFGCALLARCSTPSPTRKPCCGTPCGLLHADRCSRGISSSSCPQAWQAKDSQLRLHADTAPPPLPCCCSCARSLPVHRAAGQSMPWRSGSFCSWPAHGCSTPTPSTASLAMCRGSSSECR
jgi:hypothetical protein